MRAHSLVITAALLVTTIGAHAQATLAAGMKYEQAQQLPAALDSYTGALKAASGHCAECLDGLTRVQLKMELYKESATTAATLASQLPDHKDKAHAKYREGLAYYELYFAQTEGRGTFNKDPRKATAALKDAESALTQGSGEDPTNAELRMLHGRVLASLRKDEDAQKEFAACAATPGISAEQCARALRLEKNVALARNEAAPHFTAKTIDGKSISLDSLSGKVVLIDFWATWCGVCERDSDYVQSLAESVGKERFVLLEVSGDANDEQWRHYIDDRRPLGVQTRDASGEISGLFHVNAYPTYVILDGDGTVRLRALGIEGDLKGTVKKLLAEMSDQPSGHAASAKSGQ